MVLSTRVSLQWIPEDVEELTSTLVFSSEQDRFVDVRVYRDKLPYIGKKDDVEPFENVFQWVIVGEEEAVRGTNKIRFNHSINLAEILQSLKLGKPLEECKSLPDVGEFWPIEGSEDRKETGSMVNPETGKLTEYVEIWRSLSPNWTSTAKEVREGYRPDGSKDSSVIVNLAFDLDHDGVSGRIIRLGNWAQGIVYDSEDREQPISVMRREYVQGAWRDLIRYGKYEFPPMDSILSPWVEKESNILTQSRK